MSDDEDKTGLAFEKLLDGKKPTAAEKMRLRNAFRRNSLVSTTLLKLVKSWITWAVTLISSIIGAEFTGLIDLVK